MPSFDCGESGATLRFLLPVAAALGLNAKFIGRGRLPHRPLKPLADTLAAHGVQFSSNALPFKISGQLQPGTYRLPGDVSSQFITGLLLALPLLDGDSTIQLTGPLASRGYVEMTLCTLKQFNVTVMHSENGFTIPGNQHFRAQLPITIEGDWSNAAFFLAAGALGGSVCLQGLSDLSAQQDKQIFTLLKQFGATVSADKSRHCVQKNHLTAFEIDVDEIPDLVPILSVVASVAQGTSVLKNASRLRLKETDRLQTTTKALSAIGADIVEQSDKLIINGRPALHGGIADSYGDHRIAMALAVASVVCENELVITNAEAVNKSYPSFFEHFQALGGDIVVFQFW
jgi:3-phosphoshikimate 1-carboxyvinyltransferase